MNYNFYKHEGKWLRPLTTKAAEALAQAGGEVYRLDNGKFNRLFSNSVFAPNDLYYFTPTAPDKEPRFTGDLPLVCPNCGHDAFYAHQICRLDVIVDSSGDFIANRTENIEEAIYDAENPYGPFTCTKCGYTLDTE